MGSSLKQLKHTTPTPVQQSKEYLQCIVYCTSAEPKPHMWCGHPRLLPSKFKHLSRIQKRRDVTTVITYPYSSCSPQACSMFLAYNLSTQRNLSGVGYNATDK
ncbi:unnamed protein product [Aspergillus oryzae]|nr:unnamed protein product [Aspergillus oryzae]